jgi:hypothetical protein
MGISNCSKIQVGKIRPWSAPPEARFEAIEQLGMKEVSEEPKSPLYIQKFRINIDVSGLRHR